MEIIDLKIAELIEKNGRISNREIARQLNISEKMVRYRLGNMIKSNVLRVSAQFNLDALPEIFLAVVGIKVNKSLEKCMQTLKEIPSVLFAVTVTGRYDIFAVVFFNSRKMLNNIITQDIQKSNEVNDWETFVIFDNIDIGISPSKLLKLMESQKEV